MRRHALAAALALLLSPAALAQHAGHAPQQQVEEPATATTDPHAGHHMPAPAETNSAETEASGIDHASTPPDFYI